MQPLPLGFLPYTTSGKPHPGAFRLGTTPGLAKVEGVQEMAWAVDLMGKASSSPATSRAATPSPTREMEILGDTDDALERAIR